jgi:phosphoribosylformylglycinamidine synthase subunit PurS
MKFDVTITIALKEGMLDPEASAIRNAITNLGYTTESLKTARLFRIRLDAKDREAAKVMAQKMCERLLANPVIHRYEIEVAG